MKQLILILAIIGVMTCGHSQSTLLWSKDFNTGLNNYYSEYPSIEMVADTIEVIGRQNTADGQKLLIVKYDLMGDTISTKTYGGDSFFNNSIIDYKFDSADHIYILHNEQLSLFESKTILEKYSLEGNLIWMEQIQNSGDTSYIPRSLALTNDTCLFITVYKEYDYPEDDVDMRTTLANLYAYNSDGNQLWKREFDPITEISWFAHDIFVYDNTAFLFTSNSLVKVDINNNFTINTNTGILNGINDVQLAPDNNLIIIAWTRYRVSKVDLNGSMIWTQYYGTNLPSNMGGDEVRALIQDSTGNIYITGRHYGLYGTSSYTNADILTLKYDSNGNVLWENRYEYGVNNADIGNTIVLKNGQVYVGGLSQRLGQSTDYDYVVLKMDSATGDSSGVYRYDGLANGNDALTSLFVFDNGNVALTGISYINSQYDWTTQLLSDVVLSVKNNSLENFFEVYPNPATRGEVLTIIGDGIKSYSISSSLGQVVQHGNIESNDKHEIQLNNFTTGMYLLQLKTENEIMTCKIIVK